MLVIRLFRTGKKNQAFFKIVVTDKTKAPRAGRYLEEVGFYNPLKKEKKLNAERIKYWISVGAKPSPTLHNLLISEKIIEGKKIPKHKKPQKNAAEAASTGQGQKPEATESIKAEEPKPEEKKEEPKMEEPKTEEPKEEPASVETSAAKEKPAEVPKTE